MVDDFVEAFQFPLIYRRVQVILFRHDGHHAKDVVEIVVDEAQRWSTVPAGTTRFLIFISQRY